MIWEQDFGSDKDMEIPEYFVYCGISIANSWTKRFSQIAKGMFFAMSKNISKGNEKV